MSASSQSQRWRSTRKFRKLAVQQIRVHDVHSSATAPGTATHEEARDTRLTLLALPAEVRTTILKIAVCCPEPLTDKDRIPGVLAVCRQLRHETSSMFWEQNIFDIVVWSSRH